MTYSEAPNPPAFVARDFPWLARASLLDVQAWQWLALLGALLAAVAFGQLLTRLNALLTRRLSSHPSTSALVGLSESTIGPVSALLALGVFTAAVHGIDVIGKVSTVVDTAARQLIIAGFTWLAINVSDYVSQRVEDKLLGESEFNSRGRRTQVVLAHRAFTALTLIAGTALVLSGFRTVRALGVSMLASAGIASVVLGIAAQKTLGGLLAGMQLSFTQPVRLGDTVVMENEVGTIEEIHLTYVVVRLWDLRRLVVPVSRFLEQPFQSWTRVPTSPLGTVELWVDFRTPLGLLREQLTKTCVASKFWDQGACSLLVTDSNQQAMKVRVLVSAANFDNLFNLRCEVREQVLAFLAGLSGGTYLPVARGTNVDLRNGSGPPAA